MSTQELTIIARDLKEFRLMTEQLDAGIYHPAQNANTGSSWASQ